MIVEALIGVFLILILWLLHENRNEPNTPKGPLRLPIFGNLLQIVKLHPTLSHVAFHKLSKIYGPIMSIKLGWRPVVVLTSYEDMKKLLPRDEFSGRVNDSYLLDRAFGKQLGVLFTNGKDWERIRKYTIRALREYGFGKQASMQTFLENEAAYLIADADNKIKASNGQVDMESFFHLSVLNIIWSMVSGKRFSSDDQKIQQLIALDERAFLAGSFGANLTFAYPALRYIPPFKQLFGFHIMLNLFDEMHAFMRELLHERKRAGEYNCDEPKNFIDRYLVEMEKGIKNNDFLFDEEQFIVICLDLFQAGSETTAGTLNFAMLWLMLYPDVQRKVREEIDRIIPHGMSPRLEHENMLDYTRATLIEIQRISTVVPLVPPRKVMEDFDYHGYSFKKDQAILVNLYSVLMDEDHWKDPTVFRPERFLDAEGKYTPDERLAFFGFGQRNCIGDHLAKANIFVFFVYMIQNFTWENIPGKPLPSVEPAAGFTLRPKPFELLLKRR